MRLRVKTASGSEYLFDNEALTWERKNTNPGHEDIRFLEGVHKGLLAAEVMPIVGEGMTFHLPGDEWVRTTPVVAVEQV